MMQKLSTHVQASPTTMDDIRFTAEDARRIASQSKQKTRTVLSKFCAEVVNRVRSHSERHLYTLTYRIPVYVPGMAAYNPDQVLVALANQFEVNDFDVRVDYNTRSLFLSWAPPQPSRKYKPKASRKKVSFSEDQFFRF